MTRQPIAIAVHGGAGNFDPQQVSAAIRKDFHDCLNEALQAGYNLLTRDQSAVSAVIAAVRVLEDSELFNAGRGAVLNRDGAVELDASIMDGNTRKAGAVAGIRNTRSPILAAHAVMEADEDVLLAGTSADRFAAEQGLETADNDYFICTHRYRQLELLQQTGSRGLDHDFDPLDSMGTVGAVACARDGGLAAATSTGGLANKRSGRIGDSAIIGAGTYADSACCAVTATGWGEYFIRTALAHDICARMRYNGIPMPRATAAAIAELGKIGGRGGFVAIDGNGHVSMPFNTTAMYRGCIGTDGVSRTGIGTADLRQDHP